MTKVLMYCTAACPFCQAAERLLVEKGVKIDKIRVDLERQGGLDPLLKAAS